MVWWLSLCISPIEQTLLCCDGALHAQACVGGEVGGDGVGWDDAEIARAAQGGALGVDEGGAQRLEACGGAYKFEGELYGKAYIAVGDAHVGDVVAQGVDDGVLCGVLGVGHQLDGLHHMGVAAYDVVYALRDEPLGEAALLGTGLLLVLDAPVHEGDDGVGGEAAGAAYVGGELGAVEAVDDVGRGGGDAVGAVGGTEQCDAQAVLLYDEGVAACAVGSVAVGAQRDEPGSVDEGEGALEAALAAVEAVVVGRAQDVEAGITQGIQVLVGGAELGVAAVGGTAQGDLEVAYGEVGTGNVWGHEGETVAVVVAAVGAACGINLCLVLHEVAYKQ